MKTMNEQVDEAIMKGHTLSELQVAALRAVLRRLDEQGCTESIAVGILQDLIDEIQLHTVRHTND